MKRSAFTVLETLVTIAIIAVVVTLVLVGLRHYRERAEAIRCGSNMRSIQVALAAAVQDEGGRWPQIPVEVDIDPDRAEDWWFDQLKNYGITENTWKCPTIQRKVVSRTENGRPRLHYQPTQFDDRAGTPYKWTTQPWLVEIGNMHGGGPLLSFPDGSIKGMDEVVGR